MIEDVSSSSVGARRYLVADRAVLVQAPAKRATKAELSAFTKKAADNVKALHTVQFPSHTSNLYERIKHNPARGLDLDYDVPSWHYGYRPYAQYVPPVDGAPQYRSRAENSKRRSPFGLILAALDC